MGITPDEVIDDLGNYVGLYNITISKEAKKTFRDIEEFSFKCNYPCNYILFFSKIIRNSRDIQKLFHIKGMNPNLAALILEIKFYDCLSTQNNYQRGTRFYSYTHDRNKIDKTAILDKALQYCVKEHRVVLENKDILFAAMDYFEEYIKIKEKNWQDSKLHTDYLTLSHVYEKYDENLWLKFGEIRECAL